MTNLTICWEII